MIKKKVKRRVGNRPACSLIIFILLLVQGKCLWSEEKTLALDEVVQEMELADKQVKSLSLEFSQEMTIKATQEKSPKIIGKAFFRKPDSFRIIHEQPREQWTICNGKTIWIWWPQENKVLKEDLVAWQKSENFPVGLFPIGVPVKKIKQNYQIILESYQDKFYLLNFSPQEENNYRIKTWISETNFLPEKLELATNSLAITTVIEKLSINPKLKEALFNFKIPAGAEIITDLKH